VNCWRSDDNFRTCYSLRIYSRKHSCMRLRMSKAHDTRLDRFVAIKFLLAASVCG
jgi:hypothetical protein